MPRTKTIFGARGRWSIGAWSLGIASDPTGRSGIHLCFRLGPRRQLWRQPPVVTIRRIRKERLTWAWIRPLRDSHLYTRTKEGAAGMVKNVGRGSELD